MGLHCLNQSSSFIIRASVAWHEANQDLHTAQQGMHPVGRVPIRHDPGPAHLVWEVSSLTGGFGVCLLLPSPAQTLQTLHSGIMNQWQACSSNPQYAIPGADPTLVDHLFPGAKGRGRRDSRPLVCQSHLPPRACFITKSMICCLGSCPPSHLTCTETRNPWKAACKEAQSKEEQCL